MATRRTLIAASACGAVAAAAASAEPQGGPALVQRYAAAWLAGDVAAVLACYHDDFTLHYFGRNALTGDHVGKAASVAALAALSRRTGWRVLSIRTAIAQGESAAIVARVAYGPRAVERDRVLVFRIADGLLAECWAYDEDQRLLDALIGA